MTIATIDPELCPDCGATVTAHVVEQDALFTHGGYGATSRTTQTVCTECPWAIIREASEVRPPRRTA